MRSTYSLKHCTWTQHISRDVTLRVILPRICFSGTCLIFRYYFDRYNWIWMVIFLSQHQVGTSMKWRLSEGLGLAGLAGYLLERSLVQLDVSYLGWLQGGSAVCQNPICPEHQVMFWGLTSFLTCFSPPFFQRTRSNRLESMSYFQEDTQPTAEIETLNPSEGLQRSARTPMCGGPVRCLKTLLSELLVSPFMYHIHRS